MKVMIVKEVMKGDVSPVAMFNFTLIVSNVNGWNISFWIVEKKIIF